MLLPGVAYTENRQNFRSSIVPKLYRIDQSGKTQILSALSWVARADRLGITPAELCDRFKTDPNRVKKLWAESAVENEKAADTK